MASTILADNGVSSGSAGIKTTADSTGALALQTTTAGGVATTAVTINASQNVGIGTSSPASKLHVSNVITSGATGAGDGSFVLKRASDGLTVGSLSVDSANSLVNLYTAYSFLTFSNSSGEAFRVDGSKNLLVGKISDTNSAAGVVVANSGSSGLVKCSKTASGTYNALINYYNGTYVGGVDYSNTATSFPTSSDIRLKKDIVDAGSASAKIDQIRIVSHGWKHDDETVEFGVIAQELNLVAPQAVTVGDDEDEIQTTWGVDYSKLVPMLIKAHQEQQALITTLTERITALEAK